MRNKLSLVLAIVCFTVAALAIGGIINETNATESVVGKVTLKAGASAIAVVTMPTGQKGMLTVTAAVDQTLYIAEIIAPEKNVHTGGYLTTDSSFLHSCQAHGPEKIDNVALIIPKEMVDGVNIKVEIF